jgi:predicted nucleic acid-binding protein
MTFMSGDKIFVDTNVLVYSHDVDAERKHQIAQNILLELWKNRNGVLSVQVLQEFYVTMTRKVLHPIPPNRVRNIIRDYFSWHIEINDFNSILIASRIGEDYKISFWDALIVAAALKAKADKILTEDLKAGQIIEGMPIENPFK